MSAAGNKPDANVIRIKISSYLPGFINQECRRMIDAVSPNLEIQEVTELVNADRKGDFTNRDKLNAHLAEAEIWFGSITPKDIVARSPRLKWIQTMNAGINNVLDTDIMPSKVMLSNAGGLHGIPMREMVLHFMLMFVKQAPLCFQLQKEKRWETFVPQMINGKTCGILGLGKIGSEVGKMASVVGMKVIALDVRPMAKPRYVEVMYRPDQLREFLSACDFMVIALPLTPETTGFIGEAELRAMKPTAYLINIARGQIIDDAALIKALRQRWIAGAGLDALSAEPLPASSELWEVPNAILTPHIAGVSPDYKLNVTDLFCKNLRRYINGQKLINLINKKRGY
jgi:phosphoglycerate dehydrogenase-like enzyme